MFLFIDPVTGAAVVTGASQIIGNLLGNKQRNKDYERQKRDALEFWNIQNEYNHPRNQKARLKEAGLNPALLYGGGKGSAAAGQSSNIDTPDLQGTAYRSPFDQIPETIGAYADIRVKQAQADLLSAQKTQVDEDALFTAARTLGEEISNIKNWREFEEWNTETARHMRSQQRLTELGIQQNKALKDEIDFAMYQEAQKWREKMPEQEYQILLKRVNLIEQSAFYTQMLREHQSSLTNPKNIADVIKIIITGLVR